MTLPVQQCDMILLPPKIGDTVSSMFTKFYNITNRF